MENYYEQYLRITETYPNPRDPIVIDWLIKNMQNVLRDYEHYKPKQIYKYMITFTIDPKKVNDMNTPSRQDQIESYIVRLFKDARFSRVYYVKEHASTNCHWHVVCYLMNCFKQDHVRYYKKIYGNVDISRSHDLSDEHTQKYLSKDPTSEIKQIL